MTHRGDPRNHPSMNKVRSAAGADHREHIIALEPLDKGLRARCCATLRGAQRAGIFRRLQDVKITGHAGPARQYRRTEIRIVRTSSFEDRYEPR